MQEENKEDFYPKLTRTEIKFEKQQQKETFFKSRFKFLQQHNGIRPACVHLFIALSGNGKSTLMKSIIGDLILTRKKFMIILSEESRINYMTAIEGGIPADYDLDGIIMFSEVDSKKRYDLDKVMREFILNQGIEVIVYDNISTSNWYGDSANSTKQAESFKKLKELATETGVSFLLVAHVSSKIKEGYKDMIDQNDIEGSKAPVKMAEFIYVIQRFTIKNSIHTTIRIAKNRTHSIESRIFKLTYNDSLNFYTGDEELDFESFNKLFKERNRVKLKEEFKGGNIKSKKTGSYYDPDNF